MYIYIEREIEREREIKKKREGETVERGEKEMEETNWRSC